MSDTICLICVVCWKHIESLEAEFIKEHSKEEAELYIREFKISKMCKRCQDQVFADPEENNLFEDGEYWYEEMENWYEEIREERAEYEQ